VDPGVIANVDDRRQLVTAGFRVWAPLRVKLTQPEQLLNPQQEAGAANPTDQNGDLHLSLTEHDSTARRQRRGGPVGAASKLRFPTACGEARRGEVGYVIDTPTAQYNRNAEIRSRDGMEMRQSA
jgi:hypothetical protein